MGRVLMDYLLKNILAHVMFEYPKEFLNKA